MSDGRLYRLLPAIYRERDEALGRPLAALLAVMEEELATAEAETAAMYENAFVETADKAALLRLAALVGIEDLATSVSAISNPRRLIANAISYHRSKGVPGSLEQAVTDVTGWPARVVEGFALLGRTQHLADVRADRGATVDVRILREVDPVRDAFPVTATRPDVRSVRSDPSRRSPSSVTVFVWPVRSLPAGPTRPGAVARPRGCFTFHPLGLDQPLFTRPAPASGRPGPAQVPRRITRRVLDDERDVLFGTASGTSIAVSLTGRPLGPADVDVVDLGDWKARPTRTNRVALDPERGRLAFAGRVSAQQVEIEASFGATADVGGGSYDRRATLVSAADPVEVTRAQGEDAVVAMAGAVSAARQSLVVTVVDDLVVDAALELVLAPGADIVIQAADATRPALGGGVTVRALDGPASLSLNGLAIGGGGVTIAGAVQLRVTHCTVPAGVQRAADDAGAPLSHVVVDHSYCGPILLAAGTAIEASSSVIDGGDGPALAAAARPADAGGPSITLQQVTVLGPVQAAELEATGCVFTAEVTVERQQTGAVRFSYVPPGSRTPARERCQPDLTSSGPGGADAARWVRPQFVSLVLGDPGYAMLSAQCPPEIAAGAAGGTEMGAFGELGRPQRRAALQTVVGSFLPYGLDAGIVEVP